MPTAVVKTPGYAVPDRSPTPNQIIAPAITQPMPTAVVKTPGYAVPDRSPTPNQVIAPSTKQPISSAEKKEQILIKQSVTRLPDRYTYQLNGHTLSTDEVEKLKRDPILMKKGQPGVLSPKAITQGYSRTTTPVVSVNTPNHIHYDYYLTRNGQTTPLTDRQTQALVRGNFIKPDGQLTIESQNRGFSAVPRTSYPIPTPNQIIAPAITQPMPTAVVKTPGYAVPDRSPTPNQIIAPAITQPMPTAVVKTPGYAVPDRSPTPNQIIAPAITQPMPTAVVKTSGYAFPDRSQTLVKSSVISASEQIKNYCVFTEDAEVYNSINGINLPVEEDQQSAGKSFNLIVKGFKEPECICYSLTDCRYDFTNVKK
jgi:hypothetical protein